MSPFHLVFASFLYHRRSNFAVACGVAACTAVLTGALLVGDSMRGSLRRLTLDRLGRIDEALVVHHLFRAALADESGPEAAAAILLQVSLENADSQSPRRANRVELIGCDKRFWQLGDGRPQRLPGAGEIVVSRPVAERLGLGVGDAVLLRLPATTAIPADSALGKKRETVRSQRVTVSEIIAADGLGAFSLRPTQRPAENAYVPLDWLAERLDQPGRVNAILLAGAAVQLPHQRQLAPGYSDYGLHVERSPLGYWNIASERMLFDAATERELVKAIRGIPDARADVQPAMTYLANTLACNGREVPYSTITAIDFADRPPLGPFRSIEGKPLSPLRPNEIALNSWAADQLHARLGDAVRLTYFEPESLDGQVREKTVSLRLAAIVQLAAAAADRGLVPAIKGMTDELTMDKWDPPFPFDAKRIRPDDEKYWNCYGPTPKAFVSLATGRRLWGSRFGQTTSLRVAVVGGDSSRRSDRQPKRVGDWSRLLQQHLDPAAFGFVFQPIRQQQLDASAGTTPFGVLFLCLSFFIIAAAVMLVALLFRLGIDRRAGEIGTLLALGLAQRQVRRILLGEGLAVAAAGGLLGVAGGIGYAALMLLGLRSWWLAAIATPFLRLYVTPTSLAIGCGSGIAVAGCAIWLSLRRIARLSPRRLLAGARDQGLGAGGRGAVGSRQWAVGSWRSAVENPPFALRPPPSSNLQIPKSPNLQIPKSPNSRPLWALLIEISLGLLAVAPTAALLLLHLGEQLQTEIFFVAAVTALMSLLVLVGLRLRAGVNRQAVAVGRGNLLRMALRNAARNPGRSTLTIGLVAAASFVIVSMDAFRADPTQQTPALHSGNGGFALVAESDQPILQDLASPDGQTSLGFSTRERKLLAGSTIVALRLHGGEDASCLNLYRPRQPRVLGLPRQFIGRDGFAWADRPRDCPNSWRLLDVVEQPSRLPSAAGGTPAPQSAVPVILEKNTANYALNLWGGLGETFEISDGRGNPVRLRVAALLDDSIFQGDLLLGESAFLRLFPDTDGYRCFLVETPPERTAAVKRALQENLGEYGFSAETTGRRLAEFLAVQNTYLSAFQSLGGLGLLLGTFGLAAVQLRNVFERRGELALLRATGFRRGTLAWLVLLEHAVLLTAGLGVGTLAAALAVLPHLLHRGAAVPWLSLAATLLAVLIVGLAAGFVAVRAVLRAPLLAALREERA
ncbi:MAG: FtsX-like permease family protein [Thermoguttaceae bacterium]